MDKPQNIGARATRQGRRRPGVVSRRSIYDGLGRAGHVESSEEGDWNAYGPDGQHVGRFATEAEAIRALARGGSL